jgi:hypothetical protein
VTCGRLVVLVSSTNKTDYQDITEILLKVALNTINLTLTINIDIVHDNIFLWTAFVFVNFNCRKNKKNKNLTSFFKH